MRPLPASCDNATLQRCRIGGRCARSGLPAVFRRPIRATGTLVTGVTRKSCARRTKRVKPGPDAIKRSGRVLDIDNNACERAMRPVAIGRKNFLFVGSDRGGRAAAVAYSLIQTCKLHHIEPFAYLSDVLGRLPSHLINRVAELLPFRWKPAA